MKKHLSLLIIVSSLASQNMFTVKEFAEGTYLIAPYDEENPHAPEESEQASPEESVEQENSFCSFRMPAACILCSVGALGLFLTYYMAHVRNAA